MDQSTQDKLSLDIILLTYNHETYIRQAFESILLQRTSFNLRILVIDDCSTDSTPEILAELAKKSPIPTEIHRNERNLGTTKSYQKAFQLLTAPYTAVLEGDDYWCSPDKLQTLVNFLEDNLACVMVSHPFILEDQGRGRFDMRHLEPTTELRTAQELVLDNFIGNFSTCIYRTIHLRELPEDIFDQKVYDWIINIAVGRKGLLGRVNRFFSVYRLQPAGTWSSLSHQAKIESTIQGIDFFNAYFDEDFAQEFREHRSRLERSLLRVRYPSFFRVGAYMKRIIRRFCPPLAIKVLKLILPPVLTKS